MLITCPRVSSRLADALHGVLRRWTELPVTALCIVGGHAVRAHIVVALVLGQVCQLVSLLVGHLAARPREALHLVGHLALDDCVLELSELISRNAGF